MHLTTVTAMVVTIAILLIIVVVLTIISITSSFRKKDTAHRLTALIIRLGDNPDLEGTSKIEPILGQLERATDIATQAVTEASADAIRLRRALDVLPQGVVICDDHNLVVFRNHQAQSLMDSHHSEVLAIQTLEEVMALAQKQSWAQRTIELYGPPRKTLLVSSKLIDDGHRSLGVMSTIEDISHWRRLEEMRKDFVANVSHELKTPIGALGLLAETLITENDPAIIQRLADRVHKEAFRVGRIIDDLLDLSRIESQESPSKEPVLVQTVIEEAIERVHEVAEQHRITVEVIKPLQPVTVMAEKRQLVSAIYNILDNAVKYSYDNNKVEVQTELATSTVAIKVQDYGIGIPNNDLDRIFERFYRVDRGRSRDTGGTGLGLSIVRHVINNHQGKVEVTSREGEGTVFTLILPLQQVLGTYPETTPLFDTDKSQPLQLETIPTEPDETGPYEPGPYEPGRAG